jgi:DNA repair exonuclease SbcCD ATPase subunit
MISKIWLRHWKAYSSLELDLREGTTFLVADNGIGKSSIIQGIYFALFGSSLIFGTDRPILDAIRGDMGTTGTAGCELTLGSSLIRLERTVEKSTHKPNIHTTIQIDGRHASENEWLELLKAETGVDAAQLALLAFVHEGATISIDDAGLNTVEMLAEVFGVGRLKQAVRQFELIAKRLDRENDSLRKSLRDTPSKRDAEQVSELQDQLAQATARYEALREQQAELERHQEIQKRWSDYAIARLSFKQASTAYRQSVLKLTQRISDLLPEFDTGYDVQSESSLLEHAASALSEKIEEIITDRGRLEAGRETALHYAAIIKTGDSTCPTCRQPLSQEAAELALAEHQEAVKRSTIQSQRMDRDLSLLRPLLRDTQALMSMPEPRSPEPPGEDPTEAATVGARTDASAIRSEIAELDSVMTRIKAELAVIQRVDAERNENALLSTRLFEGYRAAERAYLAAATMARLADAICTDRITPMADELQKRWPTLCSGSELHMESTGALFLKEGNHVVPYSSLSGGQRTLAQLTVRLLALQMATTCPFFILDEPLEHLDPRNRRSLATLLVHATHESSKLRQVLVTTYEESVTRRLSSAPRELSSGERANDSSVASVVRISGHPQTQHGATEQ